MTLLSVLHRQQSQEADCLAACTQIILQYLHISIPYPRLLRVLKSYWAIPTYHAVVVTGLDDELIYLHDPYFSDAPKEVKRDEFLLAWLERDYWYAVIRLTDL